MCFSIDYFFTIRTIQIRVFSKTSKINPENFPCRLLIFSIGKLSSVIFEWLKTLIHQRNDFNPASKIQISLIKIQRLDQPLKGKQRQNYSKKLHVDQYKEIHIFFGIYLPPKKCTDKKMSQADYAVLIANVGKGEFEVGVSKEVRLVNMRRWQIGVKQLFVGVNEIGSTCTSCHEYIDYIRLKP